MDLKRLHLKKQIEKEIAKKYPVVQHYQGAMNLGETVAIVSVPFQKFEVYAQSGPKIYRTDMDIKVEVLGYKSEEVEEVAPLLIMYADT